ncbi:hypothetical protein GGQ92_001605 [Gracilibacillus halotolerans]|uniref:Uncharacterized protein n=1 Tax=Gracilibacillus halotolerans TaxID=74386 RepID=A0A841RMZ9_9BACI|nr:hypothetical protein [Gracilibacillus halotolerans]
MKNSVAILISIICVILLGACSNDSVHEPDEIKKLVQKYSIGEFENLSASITSTELVVSSENNNQKVYKLPSDEFFVSIAPFINTTHECAIHSLTGCQGELVEQEFHVSIKDEEGNTVLDQEMKSLNNGFIDLWLPRNQTFLVEIEYKGRIAKSEISTFEGDNTCITTMQLI